MATRPGAAMADIQDPVKRIEKMKERQSHILQEIDVLKDRHSLITHEITQLEAEHGNHT